MAEADRAPLNAFSSPRKHLGAALCIVVDTSILALLAAVFLIIITGGGSVEWSGIRIRARTVENPILMIAAAVVLRYSIRDWAPFLGIRRLPIETIASKARLLVCEVTPVRLTRLFRTPLVTLSLIGFLVLLLKVIFAWQLPGFFSGDDVEIHEMSLGRLFAQNWPIWELRSAFFPMLFIHPAQRIAVALGASDPETLVLAGRVVVAFLSTAAIPVTWFAARRLVPSDARVAAVAVVILAINKLHMSFGSSELPRPVSTVFVVAAFLAILRGQLFTSAAAGTLLGAAAAFRFSEFVFIPAALLTLPRSGFWSHAALVLLTAALTAGGITAASDAIYWGHPLSSLAATVDYTLLQRQSSRGYQPPWEYLVVIPAWSTFMFVALAVMGSSRRYPDSWWLWIPFGILCLLPHKESRYLIPMIPFFSIAVARGLVRAIEWMRQSVIPSARHRWARDLFAPLLLLSVLHDVGGWRLVRSNEGVRLARYVRASGGAGIAAQDFWRLGGRIHLWQQEPLIALSPEVLRNPEATAATVAGVKWVALRSRTARVTGDPVMHSLGFHRDAGWRGEDYVLYMRGSR